jgi:hypothetical protein
MALANDNTAPGGLGRLVGGFALWLWRTFVGIGVFLLLPSDPSINAREQIAPIGKLSAGLILRVAIFVVSLASAAARTMALAANRGV